MLQAIHDRATGVIAWIIVFLISVPFALWGVNQYFEGGSELQVAVVNDQEISQRQFENVYRNQRQRLIERLGPQVANALDETTLKETLLERFIAEELLTQLAISGKMRASDAQVFGRITDDPAFQQDGAFDPERYKTILSMNGQSASGYEESLRQSLVLSQINDGVAGTALSMGDETSRLLALRGQTRSVELVAFDPKNYQDPSFVTDERIKSYFEENKSSFSKPEQVRVSYLELSARALQNDIAVTEDDLLAWYEDHRDQYLAPESRIASHILVEAARDDAEADQAASEEIREIQRKLAEGESFEALAKAQSDDPGSAEQGGSLGTVERGMMVPEFETALFALEPGEISEPVRTDFGWHLIKLDAINAPEGKAFADVRDEVEAEFRRFKAEDRYYDLSEVLADRSYEVPDTLEVAADALGLSVAESGWFSREGGSGIAANTNVVESAFSDDVLNGGNNSAPIELGEHHVVVVRVKDREPERALTLDEVRDDIKASLVNEAASDKARELAGQAREKLASGAKPEELAESMSAKLLTYEQLERLNPAQDAALRDTVFKMSKPTEGSVETEVVALDDGSIAAIRLTAVTTPAADQPDEQLSRRYGALNGQREYTAVTERLKAAASVRVFKDNL